ALKIVQDLNGMGMGNILMGLCNPIHKIQGLVQLKVVSIFPISNFLEQHSPSRRKHKRDRYKNGCYQNDYRTGGKVVGSSAYRRAEDSRKRPEKSGQKD